MVNRALVYTIYPNEKQNIGAFRNFFYTNFINFFFTK